MSEQPQVEIDERLASPSIPHSLARMATRTDAGFTFLRSDGTEVAYTFADLHSEMLRRAHALLERGFKKGDRLGFIVPEGEDFVLTFLGALAAGIVPVPMYPPFSFGKLDSYIDSATRILSTAGARALITDSRTQAVLWSLMDSVPSLKEMVTVDTLSSAPVGSTIDIDHLQDEDIAFLQFTSGSTADPKGVVVTHGSLRSNCQCIMTDGLNCAPTDRAVSWLPLYHDMGLIGFVLSPIWYGISTYFIPTLSFVKHPAIWMETMSKWKGNLTFGPNFAYALAARRTPQKKLEKLDLAHIKAMGCGAEPNHPGTLNAFLDHFEPAGLKRNVLLPAYGMAEATLAITFVGMEDELTVDSVASDAYHEEGHAKPAQGEQPSVEFVSCGRAFPEHVVKILDDNGKLLGDRQVGEVVVEGPSLTAGYYENPGATEATFKPDGLRTGDLGYLADGELFITGRKKDVVILNGRNYDPQTIEWAAADVPGIRKGNVVAFSRPSAQTEELVVIAETKSENRDELRKQVAQHIRDSLYLQASDIVLVAPGQLPKTSSGKLQRRKTRTQYLDGSLGKEGVRTAGARAQRVVLARHILRSLVSRVRHSVRTRSLRILSALPLVGARSPRS